VHQGLRDTFLKLALHKDPLVFYQIRIRLVMLATPTLAYFFVQVFLLKASFHHLASMTWHGMPQAWTSYSCGLSCGVQSFSYKLTYFSTFMVVPSNKKIMSSYPSVGLTIAANVAIATRPAPLGAPRSSVINLTFYII